MAYLAMTISNQFDEYTAVMGRIIVVNAKIVRNLTIVFPKCQEFFDF